MTFLVQIVTPGLALILTASEDSSFTGVFLRPLEHTISVCLMMRNALLYFYIVFGRALHVLKCLVLILEAIRVSFHICSI